MHKYNIRNGNAYTIKMNNWMKYMLKMQK